MQRIKLLPKKNNLNNLHGEVNCQIFGAFSNPKQRYYVCLNANEYIPEWLKNLDLRSISFQKYKIHI